MKSLYALLVGVDAYQAPVRRLRGCRNDIAQAADYLASRVAPSRQLFAEVRCDGEATRAAVIDGFRRHLGAAGPEDTALFWFSGHGSQAPVPPQLAHTEPTGLMQTLLCVDSRHAGVPDLYDKEVAILMAEVAARGAHVVAVLDCCHADGATRQAAALRVRYEPASRQPPPMEALLPELGGGVADGHRGTRPPHTGGSGHVALAACQSDQAAHEIALDGGYRGVFSLALLHQLARLGPAATYRQLMTGARCYVENAIRQQVPVLHPIAERIVDQPFLGGQLATPVTAMTMRFVRGEWEIDAGSCHGLPASDPTDPIRLGVPDSDLAAEVLRVHTTRSTVAPVGWEPDEQRQYDIVLTGVPLPATTVTIVAGDGGDEPTATLVAAALATAAPGGRPSPHLRAVPVDGPGLLCDLRVQTRRPGVVDILGADGAPLTPATEGVATPAKAARVIADLEHIARWRQLKALENPLSRLAGAVHVELVAALPGEMTAPPDREPLPTDEAGVVLLDYHRGPAGWTGPQVFIRLRNTTDRELYCVLLDLTDRFQIHAALFPGGPVSPRHFAWAAGGGPVELSLPAGRRPYPGARGHDWLKLLVAEERFNSSLFELPRLGEPATAPQTRRSTGFSGVIERLGRTAMNRDIQPGSPAASDWTTSILPVITRVPAVNGQDG